MLANYRVRVAEHRGRHQNKFRLEQCIEVETGHRCCIRPSTLPDIPPTLDETSIPALRSDYRANLGTSFR
jgi:hypothetical protein